MKKEYSILHFSQEIEASTMKKFNEPLSDREERLLQNLLRAHREIFGIEFRSN